MAKRTSYEVASDLSRWLGIAFSDAHILARAEKTLHRWSELECGDGNEYASWSIERDEETGVPYRCVYPNRGEVSRQRIPDRESYALRRVKDVCAKLGLHFYQQTDPRGCALYVSRESINGMNYTNGTACC